MVKKTNQIAFRVEQVIKRTGDKVYVKWTGYHNSFNNWIDKKRHTMSEYFSKLKPLGRTGKTELDLSNYATKPD